MPREHILVHDPNVADDLSTWVLVKGQLESAKSFVDRFPFQASKGLRRLGLRSHPAGPEEQQNCSEDLQWAGDVHAAAE